jgi:type IV secretory pathway VirB2 component (pilin)/type IV secretory pathway TrbD component
MLHLTGDTTFRRYSSQEYLADEKLLDIPIESS